MTRHNDVADICRHENIHFIKHDMPYRNDMIRIGVTHIINNSYSGGILFLPADQPLIKRTSLQLLCLLFVYHNDKICRLSFNGNAGSPCIFPSHYFNELLNLPEHKGGGFLIKKYPAQVIAVPEQDKYELYDIDTPDDIIRLSAISH